MSFGSGYPKQQQNTNQNNAPPFGAGYPQQPYASPMHPQQQIPYPNPYQPSYPVQQPLYQNQPMYQNQSQAGYPVQPQYSPQATPYPNNYANQMPQPGYPTQPQPYPPSSANQYYPQNYPVIQAATSYVSHAAPTPTSNRTKSKGNPTVVPIENFRPVDDAKALRKAMKGFGTDEEGLINVLCRRSNEQIQVIAKEFKTNFGKDLTEDVISETSGNFEKVLVARLTPIVDYYVKELHDAISGIGTDEDVLIEVLCSLSNYEIQVINDAYMRIHKRNLEADLMGDTSGNFKRLLISLCAGSRDESGEVNMDAARRDATELLRAGELRIGTDESTFNMIFCQRNFQQLKLIFDEYQNIAGHSIERAIEKEFSGDVMEGLLAIVQIVSDKPGFYASRLHKSMAGLGTTDSQLIRIVVTRCEIDMLDIKAAFQAKYGDSLRNWIKGDTSGHYKHALYVLIGEQKS